jgi:hypothetical protein
MHYSPFSSDKYFGKVFITERKTRYVISEKGVFWGPKKTWGVYVDGVAGINTNGDFMKQSIQHYSRFNHPEYKRNLDNLMMRIGEEPREGLRLIVSFRRDQLNKKARRSGAITSPLAEISDL